MSEPELIVRGITTNEWARWRQHPVTQMFRQYLRDARKDIVQAASDLWESGDLGDALSDEMRGRVKNLAELDTMTFDELHRFYAERDQQEPTDTDDVEATDAA